MPEFTPEQQRLEELVERCLAEAEDAMETNEGILFDAVMGAQDFADAQVRLLECWPKILVDALADILHRGLVAAECWGRFTVDNESAASLDEDDEADFAAGDPADIRVDPLAMKEALEFWKSKMLLSSEDFNRLDERAKLRAFAVSGIAKGKGLEKVYGSLTEALTKGKTFHDFKKECEAYFTEKDASKKLWQMQNVFYTNLQTAYNVGRFKKQKELAKHFPYLRYSAVHDSRTRPVHLALDGLIYPIDHPFWDTWYPPNGFQCRCGTRSLTKGQVKRLGLTVETDIPKKRNAQILNTETGVIDTVEVDILPEPGFAHHPGKAAWGGVLKEGEKPGKYRDMVLPGDGPQPLQKLSTRKLDLPDFPMDDMLPGGLTDAQCIEAFNDIYLDKKTGEYLQVTDKLGDKVLLSPRAFQADKGRGASEDLKGYKSGHSEIIPLLAEMIEDPFEVWLVPQENDAGKVRLVKRYIGLWQDEEGGKVAGMAMFEVVDGILQGVTAFLPQYTSDDDDPGEFRSNVAYVNKQRNGYRLYRRGRENKK